MGTRTGTYYTGSVPGTVGSLITVFDAMLVTGEGFTKPYAGTNGAHYQMPAGSGYQVLVNDNAPGVGGAREALVRGAESASAFGTLIDPFPSVALESDATCVWRKSDTADATARNYWAVADDRFFIMVVQFGVGALDCYMFGDIEPFWTGDAYACIVNNRGFANNSNANRSMEGMTVDIGTASSSRQWFARTPSGAAKIDRAAFIGMSASRIGNVSASGPTYPDPSSGKLQMRTLSVRSNGTTSITPAAGLTHRGTIPFFMEALVSGAVTSLAPLDTFTDTAYDAASSFIIFVDNTVITSFNNSRYILQTAGTWNPGY